MSGFDNKKTTGGSSGLTAGEVLWVQSGNAGVVKLGNISATPGTIAGVGQIYTKISDGLLYYLSGAGVEYNLTTGGGGGVTVTSPSINGTNVYVNAVLAKWIDTDTGHYYEDFGYTRTGVGPYTYTFNLTPNLYVRIVS